jgi:hypothetical protein
VDACATLVSAGFSAGFTAGDFELAAADIQM